MANPNAGRGDGPADSAAAAAARAASTATTGSRPKASAGILSTTPRGHGISPSAAATATTDPADAPSRAIAIPAEQYGRLARMLAKNLPVTIEADIKNTYTPDPPMFNVVGEIRGTDKADEVVMLGAHFDSWHASTGATDNAAGSAAMMEAMRILKQSGVHAAPHGAHRAVDR